MKKILKIIPFALPLLFVPSAQASTPEILSLEDLHKKAQQERLIPIRESDRKAALSNLIKVSTSASRSSDVLFRKSLGYAQTKARQAESSAKKEASAMMSQIKGAYDLELRRIKEWTSVAMRSAEDNYKKEVVEINKEAAKRLAACTTAQCRQNVESWKRAALDAASKKLSETRLAIRVETDRLLAQAREVRSREEADVRAWLNEKSRQIEKDFRKEEVVLLSEHDKRSLHIKRLTDETRQIILTRCTADPPPGYVCAGS